ncbi:MAG TPA: trehalose-phosphatase [Nocardioides sp.]|uniref:trehalose-phosphatase n=1 Tax=Nocardioides sp. TaxID=35761 RepID=UPI002BC399BF|nr:trehalose-phosphatase [Nocardioides sp.]HQR26993.1 trehalose-phosphatase [Nocardioides sp.]
MDFTSEQARHKYDAFVAAAPAAVVGLDMDGTLSPIVDDPALAHVHPDAPEVLVEVARAVRAVAIITGRPARQALALGGLDEVGEAIAADGRELYVFGQYGHERWSSSQRRVVSPRPPAGLGRFLAELPAVLRRADAATAYVEEKGLGVAVHTRRMPDPAEALDRILAPMTELATRHGLLVEPGRNVVEVRAPGVDKGWAVHTLAREQDAGGFLFAGDDLGDVEAFAAVDELAGGGLATLLVCSASREQSALRERADVVVPGPEGVLGLLRQLAEDVGLSRRRR